MNPNCLTWQQDYLMNFPPDPPDKTQFHNQLLVIPYLLIRCKFCDGKCEIGYFGPIFQSFWKIQLSWKS